MERDQTIDFSRLTGFDQAADDLGAEIDFRADAIGGRLGAKRGLGGEPTAAPERPDADMG